MAYIVGRADIDIHRRIDVREADQDSLGLRIMHSVLMMMMMIQKGYYEYEDDDEDDEDR